MERGRLPSFPKKRNVSCSEVGFSPKLMSILEKARNANVTRVGGANHTAGKDPESSESTLPCAKPE